VAIEVYNPFFLRDSPFHSLGTITYHGKPNGEDHKFTVPREGRKPLRQFTTLGEAVAEVVTRSVDRFDPLQDRVINLWNEIQTEAMAREAKAKA